ncbi:FAD-binding protein (plasmid) [Agrobacterium tumefaciens F2]|jgi:FAD/FMN-containing dehydrogenase|nr:FAD-binding protein [Agrobacterium tumefaciens F2]
MSDGALAQLRADLADIPQISSDLIPAKSRDFYWFSPILKSELSDKVADLVVVPQTREQLEKVASACARWRIPLTLRGGGTGNYGQAVPLHGGVVLDMTGFNKIISSSPGVGRFEAGCRLLDIDKALKPMGWEMRFFPSTRRFATIGGYIAGGAGGIGSCTWGQLADPGAVIAVELLTVEETPRTIRLRDRDALKVLHAYGINGIITEVEMPLAPRQPWAEGIVTFPDFAKAVQFAHHFTAAEGIAKKLVSIHEPAIAPYLGKLASHIPAGTAMAILMVSEPQMPMTAMMASDFGGELVFERSAVEAERAAFEGHAGLPPLYEFTWNHTTWRAVRTDQALTYLQLRFPAGEEERLIAELQRNFAGEMMLHLEFQRRNGRVFVSGLPLVRFSTPDRLGALMHEIEALGIQISNPHTFQLDGAGWKRTDAPQAEFKQIADPLGLLNPGKLKAQLSAA